MAKKKTNNRGGSSAAKKKPNGIALIAALAFLLAVAYVITSLALGMQWNPLTWIKHETAQEEPGGDVGDVGEQTPGAYAAIDADGKLMREGVIYTMPESFAFIGENTVTQTKAGAIATAAANTSNNGKSVTITATVTPEDASDKRVSWTCDNPGVNVAPVSEGSNIAIVTIISLASNVFSEGYATITCTSISNPLASATCQVTRLASVDEVYFGADLISQPPIWDEYGYYTIETSFMAKDAMNNLCLGSISNISISIEIQNDQILFDSINSQFAADELPYNMYEVYSGSVSGAPPTGGPNSHTFRIDTPAQMFFKLRSIDTDFTKVNNIILRALKENKGNFNLNVDIVVTADYMYKNTKIGVIETTIPATLNLNTLWAEVEGVEIGGGDVVVTP